MLLDKEISKLIKLLINEDFAKIEVCGVDIYFKIFDNGSKLFISTPVYVGGDYIPQNVRQQIEDKPEFDQRLIHTSVNLDDHKNVVYLNFIGGVSYLDRANFSRLFTDFFDLAENWRAHLDEHDRNDRVYINQK